MSTLATPPRLVTLDTKPSWHNRAGRVDRSAFFVITAAQHWRRVQPAEWTYRVKRSSDAPADSMPSVGPWSHLNLPIHLAHDSDRAARPLPKKLCDRYAELNFFARDLWLLHKWEPPYPLQGDFRSAKSNALRAHSPRRKSEHRIQAQRDDAILGQGPVNPNRGVGFNHHKMLGLDCMWQTTLRIERYVQHAKLKQHFFVCPVCGPAAAGSQPGGQTTPTRSSGRGPTATKPSLPKLPPGRVTKLYLPLCTPQEYEDAQIAKLWLSTHCHPNRPWPPAAVQLIERYSELFEGEHDAGGGRQLRCRHCLGLRYGEFKPNQSTKRQRASQASTNDKQPSSNASTEKSQQGIRPSVARRLTEQSLFLNNLPKLLACPEPVEASITQHPSTAVEDLSQGDRDKLMRLFAGRLPVLKNTTSTMELH